jgi:hypothetical protein
MEAMPTKEPTVSSLAITYVASGGFSRTDARLTIDEQGAGRLFLGSPRSLPPAGELETVGLFEGPVDARLRTRLVKLLAELPAGPPAGGAAVPGSVIRHLAVTTGGRAAPEITIPGYAEPPLDAVETVLQKLMTKLVTQPAEAVRLRIETGGAFVLSSVGTRPVRLVSLDGLRGTLVRQDPKGAMLGTSAVAPPTSGRVRLAPGEELRLPVAVPEPGGRGSLSGGLEFLLDVGGQPRRVVVQARPVALR